MLTAPRDSGGRHLFPLTRILPKSFGGALDESTRYSVAPAQNGRVAAGYGCISVAVGVAGWDRRWLTIT